mmetsp:Transcript_11291/g.28591  ORF Transcript_11291/g.28591 Transcript_11291/m.28591 type:complete len:175 (-) Transcript_11291:108-632(-)
MSKKPIGEGSKRKKSTDGSSGFKKSGSLGKSGYKASRKSKEGSKPLVIDDFIGKTVQRYWPDDGGWVQGAISDFNAANGEHCIVYDLGKPEESWEWYNVRNASGDQCRIIEGAKVDLLQVTNAPAAIGAGSSEKSLEELEKLKQELKAKEELLQAQLRQLESDDEADITYSDSD